MEIKDIGILCSHCKRTFDMPRWVILDIYKKIMSYTQIPKDELKVFESLKDVKVVFDVGARDDVDYLIVKPGIELHAFEPNPISFEELKTNVGDTPNVYLNNFGLGDVEGFFEYDNFSQSIGKPMPNGVLIRRLDDYVKEHGIEKIDFLKIDTEGFEPEIFQGGKDTIKKCRYIQYEQGSTTMPYEGYLQESDFTTYYIGYRNILAVRKGELMPWIPEEPKEGGVPAKDESNYLAK